MLTAEGISKSYKSGRRKILDSLEISIDEGEFIAVMGESGSGKSTLLAVLAGILDPDLGQVLFEGKDLYKLSDEELSDIHKRRIGYVPQSNFFLNYPRNRAAKNCCISTWPAPNWGYTKKNLLNPI